MGLIRSILSGGLRIQGKLVLALESRKISKDSASSMDLRNLLFSREMGSAGWYSKLGHCSGKGSAVKAQGRKRKGAGQVIGSSCSVAK